MSEVCAVDAEPPRTFLPEQVPFEQLTAALIALRVPSAHKLENQNVLAGHDDILAARNASGNQKPFQQEQWRGTRANLCDLNFLLIYRDSAMPLNTPPLNGSIVTFADSSSIMPSILGNRP